VSLCLSGLSKPLKEGDLECVQLLFKRFYFRQLCSPLVSFLLFALRRLEGDQGFQRFAGLRISVTKFEMVALLEIELGIIYLLLQAPVA